MSKKELFLYLLNQMYTFFIDSIPNFSLTVYFEMIRNWQVIPKYNPLRCLVAFGAKTCL